MKSNPLRRFSVEADLRYHFKRFDVENVLTRILLLPKHIYLMRIYFQRLPLACYNDTVSILLQEHAFLCAYFRQFKYQ